MKKTHTRSTENIHCAVGLLAFCPLRAADLPGSRPSRQPTFQAADPPNSYDIGAFVFSDKRASFIFIKRTTLVSSLESNYSPPSWGGVRGRGFLLITISLLGRGLGGRGFLFFALFAPFVQNARKKMAFRHTPSRKNAYLCQ